LNHDRLAVRLGPACEALKADTLDALAVLVMRPQADLQIGADRNVTEAGTLVSNGRPDRQRP
jgi:hypothetical protein